MAECVDCGAPAERWVTWPGCAPRRLCVSCSLAHIGKFNALRASALEEVGR